MRTGSFAWEHQILHTDVECRSGKQYEIYYTISTNLNADQFYRVSNVHPAVIGFDC